jgi:short-subunit dehydrogenase
VSLLDGRVLVTGATGGIGRAIAKAFAGRGANLILTGRREDVLKSLADELQAHAVVCDLANRAEVDRLIAEAGAVDVLVANAALPGAGALTDFTQEQVDRILEVNLRAPIALARSLAPQMITRGAGHMVFMSSLNGRVASPLSSVYSATKFGLRGFALALRQDLRRHGVGVSVVMPGFVSEAGLFADTGAKLPAGVGTRSPAEVATAVIRAVERNRAEIDVAPLGIRLGAAIGGAAPALAASATRLARGEKVAAEIAAGQRKKL